MGKRRNWDKHETTDYTRVPHNVLEALYQRKFTKTQLDVLHFIMRKTWGWNKNNDMLGATQIGQNLGIKRTNAQKAVTQLEKYKVIFVIRRDNKPIPTIRINKKVFQWKVPFKEIDEALLSPEITGVISRDNKTAFSLSPEIHTIENIDRKIKKEKEDANESEKPKKIFSDSSLNYNDKYPDYQGLIKDLKKKGLKHMN